MSAAIDFAVRSSAGGNTVGTVGGGELANFIQVGAGDSISLNISKESVLGYQRVESDLVVELADGRTVVLLGYFDAPEGVVNRLYLSSDNTITEVLLSDGGDGYLMAGYGPVSAFDKWSPLDDLRFAEGDPVVAAAAGATDEPAGMGIFAPALLGLGGGGLGAVAAGGAVLVGGAALAGGGGSGGSGSGDSGGGSGGGGGGGGTGGGGNPAVVTVPSVNGSGTTQVFSTNPAGQSLQVTGTGQTGDTVVVTVGTSTQTTTIGPGGTWSTTFPTNALPPDGNYTVGATFSGSTSVTLTGGNVVVDMTPPPVAVTEGTGSVGDVENLAEYADGVTIKGTGEAGAEVKVKIGTVTETTTVLPDGSWSVNFTQSEVTGGERTVPVEITSKDIHNNITVVTDTLVLDTVLPPVSVGQVSGDGYVNRIEQAAPVVVGGSTAPNGVVMLTIPGVVAGFPVTANAQGQWSYSIATGTLAEGTYSVVATTTDAAGNPNTANGSFIVDTQTAVSFASTAGHAVLGDGVVNLSEKGGPITVTGQAEAGSTAVHVTWQGTDYPASVNAAGAWTVTLPAGAAGNLSGMTQMQVTSTDRAGNTGTNSMAVRVDLEAGLAVGSAPGGADGVLSGSERAAGFTLEGTADAGARVFITYRGQEQVVTADGNGRWTLPISTLASGEIARGADGGVISVYSIDAANNRSETITRSFAVDTVVRDFTVANPDLAGTVYDGVRDGEKLNAAERSAGLLVQGTVEPGSFVTIQVGQFQHTVSPLDTANGTWSYRIPASALPEGANASATISVQARDAYGNQTAWEQKTVAIDTVVTDFARANISLGIGADNVLNAAEAAAGVPVSGRAEAGSSVTVTIDGRAQTVTAGADGLWTTTFARADLPSGTRGNLTALVEAVDPFGNRAQHSFTFAVDTDAPTAPDWVQDSGGGGVLSGVYTAYSPDVYSYHSVGVAGVTNVTPLGGAVRLAPLVDGQPVDSELALFSQNVPDGSYLVIRNVDTAGNEASTLYLRTSGVSDVDLSRTGLSGFDLTSIDLSSTQGRMVITADQLQAVTGPDQKLTINGESNDSVTLRGATGGAVETGADGQRYAVYTLGGATLYVDEDISRTVT